MLVKIVMLYFFVYVEVCSLNTQQANKLVTTETEFRKRPAIKSRTEEF
jgi:hypothetical protein